MRAPWTELYLHFAWSTWHRKPMITPGLKPRLLANLHYQAEKLGAEVIAVGGVEDHVHLLVRFPTSIAIGDFVGRVKGASSHFVTHLLGSPDPFKWQYGYGAFSVSRRHVNAVRAYIENQEAHHRQGSLHPPLERTGE